jgi:MFS family permease
MGAYGFVASVPLIVIMVIPHGLMEAIQSPGTQAALSDAAPHEDAAAAQGLGEAAGSAAAAIGAFTAAPLFAALGAGPAWLIAALVMGTILTISTVLDRPRLRRSTGDGVGGLTAAGTDDGLCGELRARTGRSGGEQGADLRER